jgi:hypothetical protein
MIKIIKFKCLNRKCINIWKVLTTSVDYSWMPCPKCRHIGNQILKEEKK